MRNEKIVRYPKHFNMNIGVLFFLLLFAYLIICVYKFTTAKHVAYYEVDDGSIRLKTSYTAMAIREETIVESTGNGYVNYYLKDNSHANSGALICSIDENGDISKKIMDSTVISEEMDPKDYKEIVSKIRDFTGLYNRMNFFEVNSFKTDINGSVMEALNLSALNSMSEYVNNASSLNTFHLNYAPVPGIVAYYIDGYENIDAENFKEKDLNELNYVKNNLKVAENVKTGDPVYKLVTSEKWQLLLKVDKEMQEIIGDDSVISISFKADETTCFANVSWIEKGKEKYLLLTLNNSMIRYVGERFIDIEIITDKNDGLKIPNSAIIEKDFLLVPDEYITTSGSSSEKGVALKTYDENGNEVPTFVKTDVYFSIDGFSYISEEQLEKGMTIMSDEEKHDEYVLKKTKKLKGVYNINKGFATFKKVDILFSNEEYSIVDKGVGYSLAMYDHIALDGTTVSEGEIITGY